MSSYYVSRPETSHHEIFPGVHIFTCAGERMMLSVVELQPGSEVLPHSHPHEQMGMLLEGELRFTIDGETKVLAPGEMWRIPGGITHGCVAGKNGAKALDVFHPVRDDYR